MYDAKKENINNSSNFLLKSECISDTMYFEMSYQEHIKKQKPAYVPLENIFE